MSETGYPSFKATVDKTNQVLKDIEKVYGWPTERRQQSYAGLRAVLHALRDRLPVAESADFAAQLPLLIRGLYYEGWSPSHVPVKMDRGAFLERVRREFGFEVGGSTEELVHTVLRTLRRFVTAGEWDDIAASLPRDMATLLPS